MLFLDTSFLSETDSRCWQFLLQFAVRQLSLNREVLSKDGFIIDEDEEFVFISSCQVLSRCLLINYSRIYIAPQQPPRSIDCYLYQQLLAEENTTGIGSMDREIASWLRTLKTASPRVSLLSSVFSADVYLEGFLENMAGLEGYDSDEHFLIRPGSPGDEHSALLEHVQSHPGAIYINLKHDPGLYQVWNMGAQLATAPYLSNANLDDRRAPDHLVRLCDCLDSNPDVAAASCRLRVTDRSNLPWVESGGCPQVFANEQGGRYAATSLVKQSVEGLVSRNLPHCMPVWRRRLHADYGEFDEKSFGPSADWEFWLRAGVQGEAFYFFPEPLGLYLQHPDSYWHRQEESKQRHYDRRILQRYSGLLQREDTIEYQPLALDIVLARRFLKAQDYGSGICWLLRSVKRGWHEGQSTRELLAVLCRQFLDCGSQEWASSLFKWSGKSDGLLAVLLDLVHGVDGSIKGQLYRTLGFACIDWYEMTGERQWLLLRALLARLSGQSSLEIILLKGLYEESPRWFWEKVQSVYRFAVPLQEMVALLGCMRVANESNLESVRDLRLVFFPDYRSSNSYTELLYRSVFDCGGEVDAAATIAELEQLAHLPSRKNVVHLHWIQAVFKDCREDQLDERADAFLKLLIGLQQKGFVIYWTVHNRLSHDGQNPAFEVEFRNRLAALVERIYLHHPLAIELLEWLDHRDKICLVEHGSYTTPGFINEDPQVSRRAVGVDPQGFIVCHLGLIRDYKGLEETFPVVLDSLRAEKNAQLVAAGRIVGVSLQKWLQRQSSQGLVVKGERLTQEALERFMHAADFGFLSYREVLTSGSLFHWFSCGRPVIAPAKGTIPAYVVDGWNGFLYADEQELRDVIRRATLLSMEQRKQMGGNALAVANQLKWVFF